MDIIHHPSSSVHQGLQQWQSIYLYEALFSSHCHSLLTENCFSKFEALFSFISRYYLLFCCPPYVFFLGLTLLRDCHQTHHSLGPPGGNASLNHHHHLWECCGREVRMRVCAAASNMGIRLARVAALMRQGDKLVRKMRQGEDELFSRFGQHL
jgi:hypothetical protein